MRLFRAARGPEFHTKTQNEDAYITIPLLQIRQIVRWLVLLAIEKDINVRLDG